jgi:hypothetical protein
MNKNKLKVLVLNIGIVSGASHVMHRVGKESWMYILCGHEPRMNRTVRYGDLLKKSAMPQTVLLKIST